MNQVITNVFMFTSDTDNPFIENGYLRIENDQITALGSMSEFTPNPNEQVMDGHNRMALMPGLIDTHSHSSLLKGYTENRQLIDWLGEYQREHQVLEEDDAYAAMSISYLEALKGGTTTVLDMYRFPHKGVEAANQLGMRLDLAPYGADVAGKDFFETIERNEDLIREFHNTANGKIKIWVGLEHLFYCSKEMFAKARDLSEKYGVAIHTHTSEQQQEVAAVQEKFGKRPIELFEQYGILKPGTLLAHCVWLDDHELDILRRTGTSVAHCPVSNAKLACGMLPYDGLRQRQISIGLGTDGGISNNALSMFESMKFGSLIQKLATLDAAAMSAETALSMATIEGARVLGRGDEVGSLEVGKKADVIAIDLWQPHLLPLQGSGTPGTDTYHHPLLWNIVFAGRASDVQHVWIDGEQVVKDRQTVKVKEMEILDFAHRQVSSLIKRREQTSAKEMLS